MKKDKYIIEVQQEKFNTFIVYEVQMRYLFRWITIKRFVAPSDDADEVWWAEAQAQNLLDELNKDE